MTVDGPSSQAMIVASCHCGAVTLSTAALPPSLTSCTCSICRRLGARWAYYRRSEVRIEARAGALQAYVWGDRSIEFYHCTLCGCPTHYEAVDKSPESRLAINANGFEPERVAGIKLRIFDGASTWKYLPE